MYYTIYQITNKLDGKIYIGKHQTKDLIDGYMGSGKLLTKAQKKHGFENFEKHILFVFETEEEMNLKEAELVTEEFCAREDTYNLCPGGKGGWGYINNNNLIPKSTKITAGISAARKTNEHRIVKFAIDEEYKKEYSTKRSIGLQKYLNSGGKSGFQDKRHTIETKYKLSQLASRNQTGIKNSQFGTCWITNGEINKKHKLIDNIPEGWYKGRIIKI